jgi:hypothetical protein
MAEVLQIPDEITAVQRNSDQVYGDLLLANRGGDDSSNQPTFETAMAMHPRLYGSTSSRVRCSHTTSYKA